MQIVAPMIALLMVSTAVMIETVGESQTNFKESTNMTNNTEIIEMASAGLNIARSELVKDTNWCDGENADKNKGIYVDADGDGNADEKVYELYSSEFSKNYVNEKLNAGKLSIYLKDLKDCQKKMVLAKAEIDGQSKIITTVFSATPSTNQMPIVTTMVGSFASGGSVCTYLEDKNGVNTSGITNPNLSVMFDKKVHWLNVGFETTDNPTGENAKNIRIYADMEDGDISISGYKLFDEVYSTGDIILRDDAHVGYAEANGIVDIGDKVCTPTYETRTVMKKVCQNESGEEVVCTDEPFEEQVQVGESCRGRNGSYDSAKENANYEHPEFADELDDLTIDTAMTDGGDITCGNSDNGSNGGITVPAGVFSSGIGGAGNSHSYLDITNNTVFIKGADTFDIGYIRDGDTCDSPWWKAPVCSACESKECKESGNNGSAMVFPEKPTDNILDSGSWWKENKTFNGGEYIYGSLNIGNSNLYFNSGTNVVYVKGNLTFNNKTTVNIANGAKVIFVVYGNLNVTNLTKLNFNDNVAKLMIMTTGTMNFNSKVNVNGYFYSKGKIHVTNNTNIKGGIVSESHVTMTSNVHFDADASGIGTVFIPPKEENPTEITLEPNIQYDKINIMDGCVVNMNEAGTYYANDFTVNNGDMTLNANNDIEFAITNYENSSGGNLDINLPNNNSSFVMVTDTTYISNDSTHHCDYVSKCMIDTNRAEITNGANIVSTIVARDKIHTSSNNNDGGCNIKSQNKAEWNTCMDNLMTTLQNDGYNSTVGKQPIVVGNIISEYFASTNTRLCNVVNNNGDVQIHGSVLNLSANGNPVFGSISERIVNRILTAICTDDLATCVANAETDFEAVKYP